MSVSEGVGSEDVGSGGEAGAGGEEGGGGDVVVALCGTSMGSNGCSRAACRQCEDIWEYIIFVVDIPEGAVARRWIGEGSTPPSSMPFLNVLWFLPSVHDILCLPTVRSRDPCIM